MIHDVFPTPLYIHEPKIEEVFLIQAEIKKAFSKVEKQGLILPDNREAPLKTNLTLINNSIEHFDLTLLGDYIQKHTLEYLKSAGSFNLRDDNCLELSRSWFNVYDEGEAQEWHEHGDAIISGTYYYQASGDNGEISFKSPIPHRTRWPVGSKYAVSLDYPPHSGSLVLFPSWFEHRVQPNKTDKRRISISFDWFQIPTSSSKTPKTIRIERD